MTKRVIQTVLLGFLAASAHGAKPVITGVVIEHISHSAALLRFNTSEAGFSTFIRADYGESVALGFQTLTSTAQTNLVARGTAIGGLEAATRYYIRPIASDAGGNAVSVDPLTSTITKAAHGLEDGDLIRFTTGAPGGANTNTEYYVVNRSQDTFQISLTAGGAALNLTSAGNPQIRMYNNTWTCEAAGAVGEASCDGPGELPYFTTQPLPEKHPADPVPPAEVDTVYPTITGQTFTVAVDANGFMTDLDQKLSAAAAADASLNHEVVIPAGAKYRGKVHLPNRANQGGWVIVRSAAVGTAAFPPEGVRLTPEYLPHLATIELPARPDASGAVPNNHWQVLTSLTGQTHGWRFAGIHFTIQPHEEYERVDLNIAGISGNTITTETPHGLNVTFDRVCIAEVEGVTGANGCFKTANVSPTTFRLEGQTLGGTWTPGTGYIVNAPSTALASCSGEPAVCTTAVRHGLSNLTGQPVTGVTSGGVASLASAAVGLNSARNAVEISGSSNPALNGIWSASGGTTSLTLLARADGQPPGLLTCSTDCGTLRAKFTVSIDGTSNPAFNTSHVYTVVSSTAIQLDLESGSSSGGFLSVDPERIVQYILTDNTLNGAQYQNSTRWVFDRCLFDGRGFPYRTPAVMQLAGDDQAVIDSYIRNFNSWRAYNRVSNYFEAGWDGPGTASTIVFSLTLGSRKKIHNNYVGNCAGICLFIEEGGGNPATLPHDITITRNTWFSPDTMIAGKPGDQGRIYYNRHRIEFKRGVRIRIEGNLFDGSWVDAVPTGPTIFLSPRVTGNRISDVDISYNTFRRIGQAIQVEGQDNVLTAGTPATARVRIFNNLTYKHDFYVYRSNPSFFGGAGPPGSFTGSFFFMQWPTEDVVVERNTVHDNRGTAPRIYSHGNGRREGLVIRNNIFALNNDNNSGGTLAPVHLQGYQPPVTGTIRDAFDQTHRNSVFSHNVIVPGVTISSTAASYQPPWPNNYSTAACEAYWTGFDQVSCVPGSNVGARMAAVRWFDFESADFRLQPESPYIAAASDGGSPGADIAELEIRQGKVRNTRVIDVTQTGASVHYTAPDREACHVDYSPEQFPQLGVTPERISDGGGEPTETEGVQRVRSVALTGLNPGTLYYYRVQCQSEQPHGTFVTLQ